MSRRSLTDTELELVLALINEHDVAIESILDDEKGLQKLHDACQRMLKSEKKLTPEEEGDARLAAIEEQKAQYALKRALLGAYLFVELDLTYGPLTEEEAEGLYVRGGKMVSIEQIEKDGRRVHA